MPRVLGYPLDAGTRVLVSVMFARPAEVDYGEVFLRVRLFYTRRGAVPSDREDPEPGMGEIGGLILVSGDVEWPELDREDPSYVADLTNTLFAPEKLTGH